MPTLHNVTEETKTIFKWSVLGIVGLLFFILLMRTGISLKERFFPTPPSKPTVSFDKLPEIVFNENKTDKNPTYNINTLSGALPTLPDRATVYEITTDAPSLLSLERAKERLIAVGFTDTPIALSQTVYLWQREDILIKKLRYDVVSLNFDLTSNFLVDQDVREGKNLPDESGAGGQAADFLSSLSSLPQDIDMAKTKTTLYTIHNNGLVPATSLSTAQVIRVDFIQGDIQNLPIYYSNPPHSTISVFIAGGNFRSQIIEAHYFRQSIGEKSATYPLKTAEEALKELKEGKAYIAGYNGGETRIAIKDVYLAYFIGDTPQKYLMPVIVFEGNNGFFAYVSAITDVWVNN